MPDFSMNYSVSDQASGDLTQATQAIANEIEALDQSVRSVMSELEGDMATQYEAKHRQWLTRVEEMRGILQSGNQTLNHVTNNYAVTDRSEGSRWEGLTVG